MLERIINWLGSNADWFFSGLGVFALGILWSFIRRRKTKEEVTPTVVKNKESFSSNTGSIVAGRDIIISPTTEGGDITSHYLGCDLQSTVHILFIDDEEFQVVQMLKNDGWKVVKRIDDPNSIRAQEILDSDIIFVDIIGVGKVMGFTNQGIGLAAEIKRRYPQKRVVIYSGEEKHSVFDKDLHSVDSWLPKNAEPIQFIQEIENYESNRN